MKRLLLLAVLVHGHLSAQPALYSCVNGTKEYVVGAKLPPSGLFLNTADSAWQHQGYNHPFLFALDYDPDNPQTLYLAAGNGLFRASQSGQVWKLLTGSDVTELRDLAVDRNSPGTIYFAHSHGVRVTHDGGLTWRELSAGLHRKYTEAVRVDRTKAGALLVGGEEGLFRSEDDGRTWKPAGAAGFQISRIAQSPHQPCEWLATTQSGGIFASSDCGKTFENVARIGVGTNLYDVAYDPTSPGRIAVAGWVTGVAVSDDNGQSWQYRNTGLPSTHVTSVVFHPSKPGRLYAAVNEEALYVSEDAGLHWSRAGLDGSTVAALKFVPGTVAK